MSVEYQVFQGTRVQHCGMVRCSEMKVRGGCVTSSHAEREFNPQRLLPV